MWVKRWRGCTFGGIQGGDSPLGNVSVLGTREPGPRGRHWKMTTRKQQQRVHRLIDRILSLLVIIPSCPSPPVTRETFPVVSSIPPSLVPVTATCVSEVDPRIPEFLQSYAWRKLRMEVLVERGNQCECCGARPPDVRINVDHIKSRKFFPELALEINNLQVLCEECNHGKGNWDSTDWRSGV